MELRPYQTDLIDKARARFRAGDRHVLVVAPCGAGKTVLAAYMASRNPGSVLFLAHRRELLEQTEATFSRAGYQHDNVRVESIQTAARHLERYNPNLIICDECHHAAAGQWRKVLDAFPKAFVVGLTATPCRMDGKGLGDIFQSMVQGITTEQLIAGGYLAPYRYLKPPTRVDLSNVRTVRGDYDQTQLAAAVDRPQILGDAVEHYQKHAAGKQAIVYCANILHSMHTVEAFRAAGIAAEHIDGNTPKERRAEIIERFRRRELLVLSNVDLLGEGFDVPACDAVILLRPTQSTALYIQQSMRCMRYQPGKTALILDHVDNVSRHGLPDEEREWSLDPKKKRKMHEKTASIRTCPNCYCTWFAPPFTCPQCGFHDVAAERAQLEQVEGELEEVNREKLRKSKRLEEANCHSYTDFIRLARQRGYKDGWAWYRAHQRGYV